MRPVRAVRQETIRALQSFDTCTLSNAIEQFKVRTRNEGFVNGSVRCMSPQLGPRVGYALTATIRTSSTPIDGRYYFDRPDWWAYVRDAPSPKFVVIEDVDHIPGLGALFGEIHANIAAALGCVAYLTNGAVRDLPGVAEAGVQTFATSLSVSHAYAHVVEFGQTIEVGGLRIEHGNLLHGDRHGVVCVPLRIADELPDMALRVKQREAELIAFCRSSDFSFEKLPQRIQQIAETWVSNAKTHDDDPQ